MRNGITLMDGATGTNLWAKTDDKKPVWNYNIENPAIVRELHEEMIDAGSEIILTNTFSANAGSMTKSAYTVEQVVRAGVRIAKDAAAGRARVCLDIGPLTGLMDPYGDITEEDAEAQYSEAIGAGMKEKPDLILLETFIDLSMLEIAARCARKTGLPLLCSMSFEKVGKTMMGNSVEDMIRGLEPFHPDAVGLNCSLGPDLMLPVLKTFAAQTGLPLLFKPNAGKMTLSNGVSVAEYDADTFVRDVKPAFGFASYIGGCCGTTPDTIRKLREALDRN